MSSGPRFGPATADAPATAAPLSQGKDRCPERRELKANIIVRTRHIIEPVNTARPITGLYRNNSSGQQQVSWQITCHVQRSTTGELANYLPRALVTGPAAADAPATAAPLSQGQERSQNDGS